MADEIIKEQPQIMDDPSQMYIDEINNLKSNTVSKDAYLKLQEENRNLLHSLVEGQQISTPVEEKPSRSTEEIITDLNGDHSNLDHIKLVMELHNKRKEQGINDFVPMGHNIAPTDEDIRDAQQVEDFLNDLIKTADGNNAVFDNEYQRRVMDTVIPRRR